MALSEPMFIILITSLSGIVMKYISMCYKSKCASIDCWGIHIIRDITVEAEEDHEEKQIDKNDSVLL
jgi:hypothetical protein